MRVTIGQLYLFGATLAASFLPWMIKPLAVVLGYGAVRERNLANFVVRSARNSPFFWLTFFYWLSLMVSANINESPTTNVMLASIPILFVPLTCAISNLNEHKQQKLLLACVFAAFIYTLRYAVVFDWTQLLNAEYRGDKDADVFVALNAAFIFVFAVSRVLLSKDRKGMSLMYGLAVYGLLIVILIKSRGTLAAMAISIAYLYVRHLSTVNFLNGYLKTALAITLIFIASQLFNTAALLEKISQLLHLTGDGTRSLVTGSGRFLVWEYVISDLWPQSFWIGHGPRANIELILTAFKIYGTHNVPLAALVDGGILGGLPIISILVLPLILHNRNKGAVFGFQFYFISLAAALNENLMFAYGNPFAWVNLIMFAQITQIKKLRRE